MTSERLFLNIGCGHDIREGWTNADINPVAPSVTFLDAQSEGWPWPDGTFCHIDAVDLIEHLDLPMRFLGEAYRVLAPGGALYLRAPHFTSRDAYTDLTHRRGLSSESMRWATNPFHTEPWTSVYARPWARIRVRLTWGAPFFFMRILNLHPWLLKLYEGSPLVAIPAKYVEAWMWK